MKVGIVGAGLIVEHAHLPAYKQRGIKVTGIFDVNSDRAASLAEKFDTRTYATLDELLADPTVDIVDCAVPPAKQAAIANQALEAGKHLLCQKPLSDSLSTAESLVARAESLGLTLAVNQQLRWEPTIHEMKSRLVQGQLGEPVVLWYHLNFAGDYPADHWLSHEDRLFGTYYPDTKAFPESPTTFNLGYTEAEAERYPWVAELSDMTIAGGVPRETADLR